MKKITYAEAAYIFGYKKNHFFKKHFCNWSIDMECPNGGHIRCVVKPLFVAPLMIIGAIATFFYVLWDGGLKEFCLPDITIENAYRSGLTSEGEESQFGRLKKIFDN